ncbi:MAG: diguanylate cyclase, partial [Spirulinaceae cyanobacterium RM2_2_10]|nr:diguanylate cyclase [Spirulinaceae cyanobacterium RM2_2_10]
MSDRPQTAIHTIALATRPCEATIGLSTLLKEQGYTIQVFERAAAAIAALKQANPDLLLLGTQLCDSSGRELCQQLRANALTGAIPIVFLLDSADKADKLHALEAGALDYLAKPFDLDEALARIRNHLNLQSALKLMTTQNQLMVEEIQERQRVEIALRRSEEKFAKIFRSSPNPITITRLRDGHHLEVNETFCHLTGYAAEEAIGKTAMDLALWVSPSARQQLFERLSQNGSVKNYEFQFQTKDGQIRTALLSVEVMHLQGEECLLSLSNDITERVQAELALQQANQELQRLATLDGLTQVANRRRFDEHLACEWRRLRREQQPLSVILCDVDYFKLYNDTYGHQAGDACLQQVAQVLGKMLKRPSDLVARYGGEEFAIILPNTTSAGACQVAEAVRAAIADLQIVHVKSTVSDYVTLSLGVATT